MQPPGVGAAENLLRENEGYAGMEAALESLYLVGSVVIDEIIRNWARYRDEIPSSKSK
jgi:purine nucleoside permease